MSKTDKTFIENGDNEKPDIIDGDIKYKGKYGKCRVLRFPYCCTMEKFQNCKVLITNHPILNTKINEGLFKNKTNIDRKSLRPITR